MDLFKSEKENERETVEADPPDVDVDADEGDPALDRDENPRIDPDSIAKRDASDDDPREEDNRPAEEKAPAEEQAGTEERSQPEGEPEAQPPSEKQSSVDVEDALKELSARMSQLSSNLEGVQESRGHLEDKVGTVEERLSRLGSLAEAVSSEYNPFISENEPSQPSWIPDGKDGGELSASELAPDSEDQEPIDEQGQDGPDGRGPGAADAAGRIPRTDPESLEPADGDARGLPGSQPSPRQGGPTEAHDGLEQNLLLLEWVGLMLDRVGRAGLMDLLDYYQNLGWVGKDIKDQATRVAIGVEAPDRVGDGHWRGDMDLHRCSLVAIQRLRGEEVPAARLDELQLDLRRLFRE